jgi:predicted amino acid-binding ACT domain protein
MALDRIGIVRDVSAALAALGGSITHISQTVMRGYFTLILSVEMHEERTQLEIRQAVERAGAVGELEVNVRPFVEPPSAEPRSVERFTLSLRGADKAGLIACATTYLAAKGISIEDVYAYVRDSRALVLAQVRVPADLDVEDLQTGLQDALSDFEVAAHLQHENIFKATGELEPVLGLQRIKP